MTVSMYGIKNCDTIKKARKWLEDHKVEYAFHDYKTEGVDPKRLDAWCKELGFEALVNKRGTTYRKLDEATRENLDEASAKKVMLENPSIIKRPLLDTGKERVVGFDAARYAQLFT